mmetsp:Transcript_109191/g.315491  ORF Transcript_109191/g.315491 Transcript_109191/m.315491 type:complete len:205 (+) Transcript_109191:295-909(+)
MRILAPHELLLPQRRRWCRCGRAPLDSRRQPRHDASAGPSATPGALRDPKQERGLRHHTLRGVLWRAPGYFQFRLAGEHGAAVAVGGGLARCGLAFTECILRLHLGGREPDALGERGGRQKRQPDRGVGADSGRQERSAVSWRPAGRRLVRRCRARRGLASRRGASRRRREFGLVVGVEPPAGSAPQPLIRDGAGRIRRPSGRR